MCKLLDFQNSWGKVMKEVVSDLTTFAHKGCKIATARKVFKNFFSFLHSVKMSFCPHFAKSKVQNFWTFQNPWGTKMEKTGLRIEKLLLIKGVKLSRKKKVFFSLCQILSYQHDFFYWCYYPHRSRDSFSPVCGSLKSSLLTL